MMKYPYQRKRLGQPIPADFTPSQLGGAPYDWRNHGISNEYVDNSCGWAWIHKGGDWIDRDGVEQGANHWAKVSAPPIAVISLDVTDAVNEAVRRGLWAAFILKATAATRVIAGARDLLARPLLVINGQTTACIYSAKLTGSTSYVQSYQQAHTLPAVIEFDTPTSEVKSATLILSVVSGATGSSSITCNLLNPPISSDPVEEGIASAEPLDAGLVGHPSILGVHRYTDDCERHDVISSCGLSVTSERNYSPHIWDRGPADETLLPYLDNGKWIAAGPQHQLVKSDYQGDGFAPLAPGMGALRVEMPRAANAYQGAVIDSTGTTASIARIFMPEPLYGRLDRIFVRYYMRLAPFDASFANRFEYRRNTPTGRVAWADMGGKMGITPSSVNRFGYSGSSGGGNGYQLRQSWAIRNSEMGEPTGGQISHGLHTFDFGYYQPPGHKYGSSDKGKDKMFGQRGGLGGVLEAGHWYCIEQEVKLNTVMPEAPGYLPDGEINYWIDGRAAFKRSGFVMRSLPVTTCAYVPSSTRPARELGICYLDFNWYHGGTTENPIDMTQFITGLAWGHEYIGPMRIE